MGLPFPPAYYSLFTGGLINPGDVEDLLTTFIPGTYTVPGAIPTLQGLVEQLFGLFSPAAAMNAQNVQGVNATLAAPDRTVEDGINSLLFAATKAGLSVVTLAAPLVAPILGVNEQQAAAFLALGTVGLFGPLISGTGAVGTALQNIIDSDGLGELVTNFIGAPGTVADGVVNGGYGPNLQPLLPFLPTQLPIPGVGLVPVTGVFAPGIIQNPGFNYDALAGTPLEGIGLALGAGGITLLPPGSTAVLQGLVERVFGALPSAASLNTLEAPTGGQDLTGGAQSKLTLTENKSGTEVEGQAADEGPEVTPKKHRQRVELNVFKSNPLDQNNNDADNAAQVGDEGGTSTTPKHGLGLGKTPVQDLVKRITGGFDNNDDDGADAGAGATAGASTTP